MAHGVRVMRQKKCAALRACIHAVLTGIAELRKAVTHLNSLLRLMVDLYTDCRLMFLTCVQLFGVVSAKTACTKEHLFGRLVHFTKPNLANLTDRPGSYGHDAIQTLVGLPAYLVCG